ncbi:Reverse transcriptase (RNA-dependent DNA polymerase) [Popillia japonica]|uniref:Reverse transcriptase (RNA-dependent DNA polymerase) n=1 Tax=Popillia japonica TaxID=7064 RepID=A0AAW1JI00_POPJA
MSHDVRFKPETVSNFRNDSVDTEFPTEIILSQNQPSVLHEAKEVNIQEAEYHDEGNPSKNKTEEFITASVSGGSRDCDDSDEEDEAKLSTQQTSGYPKENRKSKRQRRKPVWIENDEFLMMAGAVGKEQRDPNSFSEALGSNASDQWLQAMHEEIESLKQNNTWVLVERPKNVQVLKNRWVLRQKTGKNGSVRFKARLVAKGYAQKEGSVADPCLFYRKCNGNRLYVAIYVDDGLVVGSDKNEIAIFLEMLQAEFEMTTGSLDNFLGMKISQYKDGAIAITQESYTKRMLKRFRMAESNAVSTPIGLS